MLLLASPDLLGLFSSVLVGTAVGVLLWWILAALHSDDLEQGDEWRYDVSRINELRRAEPFFRLFQPVLAMFAKLNRAAFRGSLVEIRRELQAAGKSRFWLPEEYLAKIQLQAILLFPFFLSICFVLFGGDAPLLAVFLAGASLWVMRRGLTKAARKRLLNIKRRMPFLLDLLTLLMEAGSSFIQALKQAVVEFEGHPVSTEFGRVLTDMNMGKARTEAFDNMRQRLADDEISSIIGAILQSEALGTPLASIFRTQSDVLQVKRSQRAETVAGEAGVNMLLPGILIMASTVIIILGPFLLNYMFLDL
jgi:tight adherence protein C